MAFEIRLEHQSFYDWFYKELIDDIMKMIKIEFKEIFDSVPCKVEVNMVNDLEQFFADYANKVGKWYKIKETELNKEIHNYNIHTDGCLMQSRYEMVINDGKLYLTKLAIEISETRMNRYLINTIDNLENFLKNIKQTARHEVGHLIDFASYDGMSLDEYVQMKERRTLEKAEWRKEHQPIQNKNDLYLYCTLEEEAVANANVGITPEMLIESDNMTFRYYADIDTTLIIDTK